MQTSGIISRTKDFFAEFPFAEFSLEACVHYFPMWLRQHKFPATLIEVSYFEAIQAQQRNFVTHFPGSRLTLGIRLNPSLQVIEIKASAEYLSLEAGTYLFYVYQNNPQFLLAEKSDLQLIERLEEDVIATRLELTQSFAQSRMEELLNLGILEERGAFDQPVAISKLPT